MARYQYDLSAPYAPVPVQRGSGFLSGLAAGISENIDEARAASAYSGLLDAAYGPKPEPAGGFLASLLGRGQSATARPAPDQPLPASPSSGTGALTLAGGQRGAPASMLNPGGGVPSAVPAAGGTPRISREALEGLLANPATRRLGEMLMPGGEADLRRQQQEREWAFKEKDFAADEAYRNQSLDIQRQAGARADRQFAQGRVPSGYRASGEGYEAVPGGPQDPKALVASRRMLAQEAGLQPGTPAYARFMVTGDMGVTDSAPRTATTYDEVTGQPQTQQWNGSGWQPLGGSRRPPPVPVAIQNAEQSDLDDIQSLGQINDTLGGFIGQLDEGKLQLGPVSNVVAGARNWAGNSSPESRNYASFQAGLEKLRNDTLRLNKGVQTEGDAVRAFNELVANINDPGVVRQRLEEIRQLNQRAAQFKQNQIQHRRHTNNLNALDIGGVTTSGTQPGASSSGAPGQFREGQTARNPETGEQIIFRNGAWGPAR